MPAEADKKPLVDQIVDLLIEHRGELPRGTIARLAKENGVSSPAVSQSKKRAERKWGKQMVDEVKALPPDPPEPPVQPEPTEAPAAEESQQKRDRRRGVFKEAGMVPGLIGPHRDQMLDRGFSLEQITWMVDRGFIRSITYEQATTEFKFTRAHATKTGGLLLCWNPSADRPHYSLRCDDPPMDEERDRPDKYLFQTDCGDTLACWDPTGLMDPDGNKVGTASIGTEGLFDAMASTLLAGIPCVAITAPSHLRTLTLPGHLKTYIGDCDQWMAQDLLPSLIGGCVSKGLKVARLPLREQYRQNYLGEHRELPGEAKGGMEELIKDHGDAAAGIIRAIAQSARQPGDYLRWEISELELGIRWPDHAVPIQNLISAMADAHPNNAPKRDALKAALVRTFPPWGQDRQRWCPWPIAAQGEQQSGMSWTSGGPAP